MCTRPRSESAAAHEQQSASRAKDREENGSTARSPTAWRHLKHLGVSDKKTEWLPRIILFRWRLVLLMRFITTGSGIRRRADKNGVDVCRHHRIGMQCGVDCLLGGGESFTLNGWQSEMQTHNGREGGRESGGAGRGRGGGSRAGRGGQSTSKGWQCSIEWCT